MCALLIIRKNEVFSKREERGHSWLRAASSGLVGAGRTKRLQRPRVLGDLLQPLGQVRRELGLGRAPTSMKSQERPRDHHLGWKVSVSSFQHSRSETKELLGNQE